MHELSRRHGCTTAAISQRAKKEGWIQDSTAAVARAVEAKLNKVVNTLDPEKKAQAIEDASDRQVAMLQKHQTEWERNGGIITLAMDEQDLELAKLAKITAEALRIKQDGERKAWGIKDDAVAKAQDNDPLVIEFVGGVEAE